MPYKNIVYAKLERRLLSDYRWFMMSEAAQLSYIKLILAACDTYNKIPKDLTALRKIFKTEQTSQQILDTITEIKVSFPKLKENTEFYFFEDFQEKTNYMVWEGNPQEIPRKSQGLPKEGVERKGKERKIKESTIGALTDDDFIHKLRKLYLWVNIETELKKMDAWLLANPTRKKTRRFIINWLNRIEKPITTQNNWQSEDGKL